MCTPINYPIRGSPFVQEGCQVPVGNGVCGEKRTLEFINEFKRLYERKMEEIDTSSGGNCLQVIFNFPVFFLLYLLCVGAVCTILRKMSIYAGTLKHF